MNNLVQISDNQVVTTSILVSAVFGKEHKNILSRIRNEDIPADFNRLNFKPVTYLDKKGEVRPMYEITRDGFTLLAMGFTGKKAMQFKIKYIAAFNEMEAKLKDLSNKPVTVSEHTRSLPSGKKEIVLSEKARSEIGGIVKAVLQAEIRERENIRDVFREVIREEIADYALKKGIEPGEWNGTPTGDGLPFGSWAVSISHSLGAISCIFDQLKERNKKAVKLLSGD